jgi:arginyl-tRNA synthetase
MPEKVTMLEKLLSRYADIKERAQAEYAPQHIAQYLMSLAGAFNGYYAVNQIVDDTDPLSPYRVMLTKKFVETMTDGLWLLGIKVPKRM